MGLEDADRLDDGGKAALSISCSICLEDVSDYRDRAFAKLQCGHLFHLDCIGSAFNVKGVMQCPNCRKVEKGQWLYSDGSRQITEINIDDFVNHEDVYDFTYFDSSMWCPFGEFSRLAAAVAIDEAEFPTTGYNEIIGQHTVFTDQSTRVCPFIAYVHPSTSSANAADGGRYTNNRWNNNSQSEIPNAYSFPTMDAHYNPHVDHSRLPTPTPGPTRANIDVPPAGSYVHPFLPGQSSSTRGPSSVTSALNHPHPDSGARAWERSQALEAYYHQPSARNTGVSNTQPHVGSSSDHAHRVYFPASSRIFHEANNNSMLNPYHHVVERESPPHLNPYPFPNESVPFHQPGGGTARPCPRHGSGRAPGHGQYWS